MNLRKNPVPGKGPVRLEERNTVNKDRDRGQASDDLSVDPFAVGVGAHLASAMEVDTIKSGDGDSEHKLEESKDEADEGTHHTSTAGVIADKVKSTHFVEIVRVDFLVIKVVELSSEGNMYVMLAGVICALQSPVESDVAMQGMFVLMDDDAFTD